MAFILIMRREPSIHREPVRYASEALFKWSLGWHEWIPLWLPLAASAARMNLAEHGVFRFFGPLTRLTVFHGPETMAPWISKS